MSTTDPFEPIPVGEPAPEFTLPNTRGEPTRLRDLVGEPLVLYFYPEDHTIGCTIEARRFRDDFEAIALQRAGIVGVSRDNRENHGSFRDDNRLPFELLSDGDGAVHDLHGAWRRPLLGLTPGRAVRRCTYTLDPAGNVAKFYGRVNVLGHAHQVVKDLEALARVGWPTSRGAARPESSTPPG